MSFILDALRKSETERQRGSVPSIAHVPAAVPRAVLPRWALAVMLLLGASAAAMATAWWLVLDGRGDGRAAASAEMRSVAIAVPPPQGTLEAGLPSEPRPSDALRAAAGVPALPPQSVSPLARAAGDAGLAARGDAPPASAAPAAAARTATPAAGLPGIAELQARGIDVPSLRLELHVYAATSAERYVFINGKLYREGDTLREGPELLDIDTRGAVLRYQGREFFLSQ